ncbi:MAG: HvfC/BufC family peptide modification chaperone [Polyangiaceae bacterium]
MSGLEDLQRWVIDGVLRAAPVELDAGLVAHADALLVHSHRGMSPAARLEVYREQFWLRHLASLAEDFPTLAWALGGAPRFRELVVQYLCAQPPSTWNLQRLGAGMQAFLLEHAPWNSDALAQDAARLDWAFMEAFDAPDAAPLDLPALAVASGEALLCAKIAFHPSMRIVATEHPVADVRDAVMSGRDVARPAPRRTRVVVWRNASCFLRVAPVEQPAADLMLALADGVPLGLACETVAKTIAEGGADALEANVAAWFQFWTQAGLLSKVAL